MGHCTKKKNSIELVKDKMIVNGLDKVYKSI
jgi:hypothetical protein